ncbi:MAG TPA: P27 family phage terminase small subunit [Polyangiaceae bacterium]|nr:P27 family phage terminase small subunit [Polyangiaceae bacterium]
MANLKRPKGAQKGDQKGLKSGARAKLPVGDIAAARQEMAEALAEAAPLRDKDGNLPKADAIAVEVVAAALARYRHMQEYLERVTPFTTGQRLRYTLVRELRRTEKQLLAELHELGMTPRGRAALGLDVARTGAEMQKVATPNRDPEHLLALARMLQRVGVVPELPDDDVIDVEEQPPVRRVK